MVDDICGQYANQNKHKARTLGGPGAIIFESEKSQHKVQKRKMYIHGAVYKNYGIFGAIWFDKPDPQKIDMLRRMPEPTPKQQLKAYLPGAATILQRYAPTSGTYCISALCSHFRKLCISMDRSTIKILLSHKDNVGKGDNEYKSTR